MTRNIFPTTLSAARRQFRKLPETKDALTAFVCSIGREHFIVYMADNVPVGSVIDGFTVCGKLHPDPMFNN